MDLIGKEVYVESGNVEGKYRRKSYRRGRVMKKYNGWYLIEVGGKYLTGARRADIKEIEEEEEER